jgi:hypothetical protein
MSEQQTTSACPHPEAVGKRWGDPISAERQAELQGYLDRWEAETDHGERRGPFDTGAGQGMGVSLTGADVSWLAEQEQAQFGLKVSRFSALSHLEGASLWGAHLEGAPLSHMHLEEVDLTYAHLEGATLDNAYLERAILIGAHLEAASLNEAGLEQADLSGAWLDSKTDLSDAALDTQTKLGDIQWSGVGAVNLTRLPWDAIKKLGDEVGVRNSSSAPDHERVVRAYRQVAAQLRAQGMSEVADRFLYRSQRWQRRVLWRQRKLGAYLFSVLLAVLAGYGYRLGRILVAYGLALVLFATSYYAIGQWFGGTSLSPYESFIVSLTAIHGRVFITSFGLDSLQSLVAAIESVVGIVIEGVFVAMLIQRFFGR